MISVCYIAVILLLLTFSCQSKNIVEIGKLSKVQENDYSLVRGKKKGNNQINVFIVHKMLLYKKGKIN